jgi:hypothetical protein
MDNIIIAQELVHTTRKKKKVRMRKKKKKGLMIALVGFLFMINFKMQASA